MDRPRNHPNTHFPPTADFTLDFRSDALRQLHDYWKSKLGGRAMPRRADIDPTEIPSLLAHIALVSVEHEPLRFYFRLVGTHITDAVGRDSTGCYFEEVYQGEMGNTMTQLYSVVVQSKTPVRHFSTAVYAGKDYRHYESVHLPLSDDRETVNIVFAGLQFFE